MPASVQKSMSVTILTTLFTSIGLAILLFFGEISIGSIATAHQVETLTQNQVDTNSKIDSVLAYVAESRVEIAMLVLKTEHCKEENKACKDFRKNHGKRK